MNWVQRFVDRKRARYPQLAAVQPPKDAMSALGAHCKRHAPKMGDEAMAATIEAFFADSRPELVEARHPSEWFIKRFERWVPATLTAEQHFERDVRRAFSETWNCAAVEVIEQQVLVTVLDEGRVPPAVRRLVEAVVRGYGYAGVEYRTDETVSG